ncbi:MAG: SusC/RagA family TonB-linked outer membrane protein [Bacteroidales bacterium]|nr:SusC/RagA family TonB-linked outer membrane protein [Bacteroidales bacterium]
MKDKLRRICLLLMLISTYAYASAQITINGNVSSADDKQPLAGANITVKGTTNGVVTDLSGNFTIQVDSQEDILVFSYVGYNSEEVTVGVQTNIKLVLVPNVESLDEIIVMGYNSKTRNEITSAVTVVSGDKLKDVTANNIGTMLQGKVAGIEVVDASGAPGSQPDIRIRGISSFSAPQGPLYVVDGIIGGSFDPNDVESITVLKDAGATALYGSQANGGVIIVQTKTAQFGKNKFELRATSGIRTADHGHVRMMDSETLYKYHREYFRDPTYFVVDDRKFLAVRPESLKEINTDWLAETFKTAPVHNYYLASSGTSGKLRYYIGGTYYNETGTFINTDYNRINARANTTYSFTDKVSLTNNINLNGSKTNGYEYMHIYYSYVNMPWDNPYDSDGEARSYKNDETIWSKDKINPIQAAENSEFLSKDFSVDYDLVLNVELLSWLSFSSTNRLSLYTGSSKTFYSKKADDLSYTGTGYINVTDNLNYGGISTNLLKFNFKISDHRINGLAGFETQKENMEFNSTSGTGIPEGLSAPSVASSQIEIDGAPSTSILQSFISQANYNFRETYFLTGSFRIDQSSAFNPDNRTAYFPSVSAAWLVSNEGFLKDNKIINNLKVKASWGKTGMKDIGPSMYLEQFKYTTQIDGQSAAVPFQMANDNLTWEQTTQMNAGIELGILSRVTLNADFYNNNTENLLVYKDLPPSGGFRKQWQNIGQVNNKGIDLSISTTNIATSKFTWTTDFTLGVNENKLEGFGNDTITNANSYGIVQIYHSGGTLYSWYAKEFHGIDENDGSVLWVAEDGSLTKDYNSARKIEYGSPVPKLQGGISTEVRYRSVSLKAAVSYLTGNKIYNYFRRYVDHDLQDVKFNVMEPMSDWRIWQKPGDAADHPLPQNARNSYDPSTRYIEDGSYLKIRNITLTYSLPAKLVNNLHLSAINISLSADNLYTFTRFSGQDPEVSINPANVGLPGYAEFKYPNNRQFLASLNVTF